MQGEGDAECRRFYVSARSLCPDEWVRASQTSRSLRSCGLTRARVRSFVLRAQ
jgi:hypothetical protein